MTQKSRATPRHLSAVASAAVRLRSRRALRLALSTPAGPRSSTMTRASASSCGREYAVPLGLLGLQRTSARARGDSLRQRRSSSGCSRNESSTLVLTTTASAPHSLTCSR